MKEGRSWGTAGWLEDHELGADSAIIRCQRKTKTYDDVVKSIGDRIDTRINSVFRQERQDGDICAAFLWGGSDDCSQQSAFSSLNQITKELKKTHKAEFACVTSFTYDYPSGYWQAIVVFKRNNVK